jgi:hypothetical protein
MITTIAFMNIKKNITATGELYRKTREMAIIIFLKRIIEKKFI